MPAQPAKDLCLEEETTAGSYFVSNYPPYSFWKPEYSPEVHAALDRPPAPGAPLGIYAHIPFCRKRCHFCYFKVYTDKNASEVETYLDALAEELRLYVGKPFIGGRKPRFIYFGGGKPSYLSTRQLGRLVEAMKDLLAWDDAEEVTFECEPGTLTEGKLEAIRAIGVTRLSLGVENFDDQILQSNGRAHVSKEIWRSYDFARSIGFPQINIDLIAGMMGETDDNWRDCVRKTIEMAPDSVTIYQMEIPYNTTIFQEMKVFGQTVAPVANWTTKRKWVDYAFTALEAAGYTITSAYTAVKRPEQTRFLYRDLLWSGADMVGLGVASFSHVAGTHFQNAHDFEPYLAALRERKLPVYRALTTSLEERMIRELILQMKLGRVRKSYFQAKFGVDVEERFAKTVEELVRSGFMEVDAWSLRLTREGLLRVDKLLHEFFLPEHRGARYS